MSTSSRIEWTESTWNPVTGCTKISPGCKNCYAERMTRRLHAMGQPNYRNGFRVTTHPQAVQLPLSWKKPQMVFVNPMSDLFHRDVPQSFILELVDVMHSADRHIFQILTKRSDNLLRQDADIDWSDNMWMGVTVESAEYTYRIRDLQGCSAGHRFISFEPLLGPIGKVNLEGIDWAIVGGESGPNSRPMQMEWVLEIKEQCREWGVPFFFKQWGGFNKKKNGRTLLGTTYDEVPEELGRGVEVRRRVAA